MLSRPHPGIVFQKLEEGAVLFAPATELYFGLNDVGALIWELLPRANSIDELCATIHGLFPEVAPDVIRTDVEELLGQLLTEGLIQRADSPGGDESTAR